MKPVQPIVVNGRGTHEEVCESVVLAVLDSYERASKRDFETGRDQWWAEWLNEAFTKSVRVSKSATKFVNLFNLGCDIGGGRGASGESLAVAFPPCPEKYWERDITIARVAGFERPRTGQWYVDREQVTVCPNPRLTMTTGKTASQMAHAALAWRVQFGVPHAKFSFSDSQADFDDLNDENRLLSSDARRAFTTPIVDNGLTEIRPNSLTAIAGFLT